MKFLHRHHTSHKKTQGFTLVEILVVLGIFSFLMTLATGVLYMTQAVNVKLQETQAILDNVNFTIDTISRDVRYGADFHCGSSYSISTETEYLLRKDCNYDGSGNKILFFKPVNSASDNVRVAYYASTTSDGYEVIMKDEYDAGGILITSNQVTSNDVAIKNLSFYVEGAYTKDDSIPYKNVDHSIDFKQPLVTILLSGETIPITHNSSSTKFSIQSTVTSHRIDK